MVLWYSVVFITLLLGAGYIMNLFHFLLMLDKPISEIFTSLSGFDLIGIFGILVPPIGALTGLLRPFIF